MNIQKITNILVAVLSVSAIIVLAVIISQGDEYIEMSAMEGNYGFVSIMINLAIFVFVITVLMTLIFSVKNLFSETAKLKKAGMSIGSFLLVFIVAYVLSSGQETPMQDGEMLSAFGSRLVESGIRTFYLLTIIAGGIMIYFSVSKIFKK
tara:strand:+ start:942 stop:1391 length:450 start_codon:yes stop_codon:yes gene_type:complete